jgi:hypothetical protein
VSELSVHNDLITRRMENPKASGKIGERLMSAEP